MQAARDHAFDCVLVWKFDRFARSTKHLLTALEEFDHLGIRVVSIRDRIDTTSPMGKAMFTLIGAMAELESSLISERVTAGMKAAKARGKHLGRPRTPTAVVTRVEELAKTTDLSVRDIHRNIGAKTRPGVVSSGTSSNVSAASPSRAEVIKNRTYPEQTPSAAERRRRGECRRGWRFRDRDAVD
jgi:DNA invertase Pin-like site-specific DNA recombinase